MTCDQPPLDWNIPFIPNVRIEPQLQPLSGETLSHRTSNSDDHARLDVSARGFWNSSHEQLFIDVRVFNLLAKSHFNQSLTSCYRRNVECIKNVEHGTFTPQLLVEWDPLPLLFTRDWLHCLLTRCINHTIKQFVGFVVL